jgi:hypothetical protein
VSWKRGNGTVQVEIANLQSWVERTDEELYGTDGEDIGMIQEWRDDRAARRALRSYIKAAVVAGGLVVGVPSMILAIVEVVRMARGH